MPIAQSRIISVIAAAEDYQQALLVLRERAFVISKNLRDKAVSAEDALSGLLFDLQNPATLLKFPLESAATVADEKSHFRANAKRNDSAAKLAEKKRRRLGVRKMPPTRQGLLITPTARTQPMTADHGIDRVGIEQEAARLMKENPDPGLLDEPTDADVDL